MVRKNLIRTGVLAALGLASIDAMANIAFSSIPGARANSMGGSYIAIANDTTSLFYNPAGIARISGGEVMAEYGDVVAQDTDTVRAWLPDHLGQPVTEEADLKFVGGVWGSPLGEDSGLNFGIAYAPNVYNIPTQLYGSFEFESSESIKFETQVEQLSLGVGSNWGDFAWGISLDYHQYETEVVWTEVGRNGISFGPGNTPTVVENNCINGVTFCPSVGQTLADFTSWGITSGLMWRTYFGENDASSFSLGAVYRFNNGEEDRDLEGIDLAGLENFQEANGFNTPLAPESWGVGAAYEFPLTDALQGLVTAQYEYMDYFATNDDFDPTDGGDTYRVGVVSEWTRTSFGGEVSYLSDAGWQWFFRGGYYTAEDDNFESIRYEYAAVEATTFGVGVYVPGFGKLEVTGEQRDIDNLDASLIEDKWAGTADSSRSQYDVSLISFSYTYVWF
ncbi:MAG: hypothetical protein GJ680_07180 [Alteromonadaceae bacterium]|nr:hypothetical protein [Alteromonadaceae bacterium]